METDGIAGSSNQQEEGEDSVVRNGQADHTDLPTFDPAAMTAFEDSGTLCFALACFDFCGKSAI